MDWRTVVLILALLGVAAYTRRQMRNEARRMPSIDEPGEEAGSSTSGNAQERVARIRAYLDQHRSVYNADALRRKLLADGHERREVDQAMAQVFGANALPLARRPRFYARWARREWITFAGMLLFNGLVLPALVAYAAGYSPYGPDALLTALYIPLIVVGELVLTGLFRNRFPMVHPVFWASLMYFALLPVSIGACITIIDSVAG
ncbi:MAG TPA: hypothetical protein VLA19_01755 [Herpetosiphonaceae bacterium]|nr:hypothetical protein [Herpetosiphonaceae bacterium]